MPKVHLLSEIEVDVDDLLKGVSSLPTDDLENFIDQVLTIRAHRRAPALSNYETELLQKITEGVPGEERVRYDELNQKLLNETLTSDEQLELIGLSDRIEEADAKRLEHLITLAQRRGTSVDQLMNELKLRRRSYA